MDTAFLIEKLSDAKKEITFIGIINLGGDFDFDDYIDIFKTFIENGGILNILYEFDNLLFSYSLSTDTHYAGKKRTSYSELAFRRDLVSNFRQNLINKISNKDNVEKIKITEMFLPIPVNVIKIDDAIYFKPSLHVVGDISDFQILAENDQFFPQITNYIFDYLDKGKAGKYTSKKGEEVLELYDIKKIPRGIFPRKSFYDTDYHQFVIWNFVFDRDGNLLIHKRAENAKDNQDMWDKSVGGHVDFSEELSSDKTAVRELIEELFTEESVEDSMAYFNESEKNMIFLGEWRSVQRGFKPLDEVKNFSKYEWGYFRIPNQFVINTPRILPEGKGERRLRVIVDAYIFVTNTKLNDEALKKLKNSKYKLISLANLKTAMEIGEIDMGEGLGIQKFEPTPDLKTTMNGELRSILEEASQQIKYTFKKR